MYGGSANLNLMINTARKAARYLIKDFREVENLQASSQALTDFVSKANISAESTIKQILMESRPNYGWLSEESGDEIKGSDPTRRWIVDPLDGMVNYLHGLLHFCISIALEHRGQIVTSVIYDPVKDEIFCAEKGKGAFINNTRLRVSNRHEMKHCIFSTGSGSAPPSASQITKMLKNCEKLLPVTAGIRRFGAPSLDLAYVAAGRLDGYWEYGLKPWNIAAGACILREAGGFIDSIQKEDSLLTGAGVIAATPAVYEQFLAALT